MLNFVIGAAIVIGGWWLLRSLANAQPANVRGLMRKAAGGGLIALSGFLALRGALNVAMPVFVLGLGLLGQQVAFPNGFPWQRKSPNQKSRVATSLIAMELDHDTGNLTGQILAGPLRGRTLASLTLAEMRGFHAECACAGDQSRALLETWIDRTRPEWRAQWHDSGPQAKAAGPMSRQEALAILGLREGAPPDAIRSAHRRLMKTAHPDMGGSDYLAAKINEAKDVLLQD
jgi:hypothetical protein